MYWPVPGLSQAISPLVPPVPMSLLAHCQWSPHKRKQHTHTHPSKVVLLAFLWTDGEWRSIT